MKLAFLTLVAFLFTFIAKFGQVQRPVKTQFSESQTHLNH